VTDLAATGHSEKIGIPEGDQLTAPMHGSIWKVLVEPGQRVEADQVILIIDAMKMEVAVRSPKASIVKAILCTSGQSVATGDILAVLNT
jgi:urea carboxylase